MMFETIYLIHQLNIKQVTILQLMVMHVIPFHEPLYFKAVLSYTVLVQDLLISLYLYIFTWDI